MITCQSKTKTFYLETKDTSYVFCITPSGFLKHLYYGKRIDREDLSQIIVEMKDGPYYGNDNVIFFNTFPNEYSTFGLGDYRETSLRICYPNGTRINEFKYISHDLFKVKPKIEGLPSLRGGQTLRIILSDGKVELSLFYTCYETENAIVRHAEIKNLLSESIQIDNIMSAQLDLPIGNMDMISLYGSACDERNIIRVPIGKGERIVDSKKGSSSHQQNPFVCLLNKHAGEDFGEVYGVNLIYSGSYIFKIEESNIQTTRIVVGINDHDFTWKLDNKEIFYTPEVVFVYSDQGLNKMSQSFHDLYRNYLINPKYVFERRPIVLNNWESTYFDFDNKKLCSLIEQASELGIDTFVLDDGWFGKRNNDRSSLGDWTVNTEKLQGGLNEIINCCKNKGMKFGLWFEPEMVSEDSDLYRKHPEWAIKFENKIICRQRNQLVLDLTNPDVVEYVKTSVGSLLQQYEISYVKWDMNRTITEYFSLFLPSDRQKELMHRYILGVYNIANYLTQTYPEVFFEGCASGGGRFDPAMLYYFPQIWASDNTDALARQCIQYGTSMCYPMSSMSGHVSICPNHQTGRTTPFQTRCDIASLCSTGYELNLSLLSYEEKKSIKDNIKRYYELSDLILQGDLYRIDNPFEGEYFSEIVVSKDKKRAFAICARKLYKHFSPPHILKFKGLNPESYYYVKEKNESYKGNVLMNVGLPVVIRKDFGTEAFTLEVVN